MCGYIIPNCDGKMGKRIKTMLPPIGMRIIKSALAILLCYIVSFARGNSGIVFYSQLAALWCIQMYTANSKENARQRLIGTLIGAIYGLIYLLLRERMENYIVIPISADACVISALIIVILYTTVLIHKKQASYFSCVVFLSIVVNHVRDTNPYLFVWNRFLDTVIGIMIGIGVNTFSLPKEKRKDILFISGLDDTLINRQENLSDYSKVELNRMLDEGVNFTISTIRTPASLMEAMRDIRLKLPVIAMDGAVLYDIREKTYLKVYIISNASAERILKIIKQADLTCFVNVIIDDMLVIYYEETRDEIQQTLVKEMRKSPYRNYVNRKLPEMENVVYFMLLYPNEVIEGFYETLYAANITKEFKVVRQPAKHYPGYSYLKIYNRNATKENMIQYLQKMLSLEKIITFGSIPGCYDVVIEEGDSNKVVHMLKKMYEPYKRLF